VLEQAELARAAHGSGLMARIDSTRIVRAARIARKLAERGRTGSVLATVAGDSLTDANFVGTASSEPSGKATRLVLSFTQDEVRAFSRGHLETLATLAQAGFGFALDGVTDLDMDFGGLRKLGFEFVKLDAPVFLEGLPAPTGHVPAADICRSLADFGLTLVVGKIEDDWLLARILGFGVLFGRGTLFGGPKLVKQEIVATPAAA
jgi:cyclic-di-GMP phosphodiesterase TipF (flagellum assembly factor)